MTPQELIKFAGVEGPNIEEQARGALMVIEGMVDAYTRGRYKRAGNYRPGVEEVIITAAARLLSNPEQISVREEIGPYSYFKGEGFKGFTLVELAVLNRYRRRAR